MIKINKNQAKAIIKREVKHANYFEIYVLPCKTRVDSMWLKPYKIVTNSLEKFENECNSYKYYNCNNELGGYLAYYISEEYKEYLMKNYK